ncbi:uncharacterized protein MELLADRAFT_113209 [Melampsora larici-populina 98AG31]|uniref:Uncharacterized protein n=1 Tax=Melampsora larici-populina (strain 98AG31 / pathotype 3-4-7) TaxID=747676 RepID=F4S943_MELLP|nr:uncharacterized protein MELLADRAFT_113209 [Melampsora larici-populina 98AG31]EGF98849.1 hypothetical protein MELLADRAFT_113209 [Melampsora larici-populina 98AG31]
MSQTPKDTAASSGPGATPASLKAIQRIVTVIDANHFTPKSFLEAWLLSKDPAIRKTQRVWSALGTGLQSTGRLLCAIRDTLLKTKAGQAFWEEWVLSQAVIVAKNQHPPSGKVPNGFYINTSNVTPSMFDHSDVQEREKTLENSMPFLYNLSQSIFINNQEARLREANVRKERVEHKKKLGETHLPALLPLEDFLAPKTSDLSLIGNSSIQSTNPQSAIDQDINLLDSGNESDVNLEAKGGSTIGEDNEYVQSWDGYIFRKSKDQAQNVKTRSASIPEGISTNQETFTAEKLNAILNEAEQKPIDVNDIKPSATELKDWTLTLKSQISQVLIKYVAEPIDGAGTSIKRLRDLYSINIPLHKIAACTPGSTLPGGTPNDMYAKGIAKLSKFAQEKKLDRFHWPKAGYPYAQEGAGGDSGFQEDHYSSDDYSALDSE